MPSLETSTPPGTPEPIGPYNHIARAESLITIGATAGVDPATGRRAGDDSAPRPGKSSRASGGRWNRSDPTSLTSSISTSSSTG